MARYFLTAASCHEAWSLWLNMVEKPPPEPNWSEAISSLPAVWPTKRVAPTEVTQGEDAGHDGQSFGMLSTLAEVAFLSGLVEVTLLYSVQTPFFSLPLLFFSAKVQAMASSWSLEASQHSPASNWSFRVLKTVPSKAWPLGSLPSHLLLSSGEYPEPESPEAKMMVILQAHDC